MKIRQRVALGVRIRLEMVAPYISSWPRAMAIMSNPEHVSKALAQLYVTVDEIWGSAGDTSTDYNWYTKRSLLAAVYTATEVSISVCSGAIGGRASPCLEL
eukprot:scaffold1077_cov388-Prasinococcus_capsulatus_cf.AAC.12